MSDRAGLPGYDEWLSREPEATSVTFEDGNGDLYSLQDVDGKSVRCDPVHGSEPLYENADHCKHVAPPEPGAGDDSTAWDDYQDDHPSGGGLNGETCCLLTRAGVFCPACTQQARDGEDLPTDEYVACRLGAPEGETDD